MGVEPCVVPPTSRQRAGSQGEGCPGRQDSAQVRKSSCTWGLCYPRPGRDTAARYNGDLKLGLPSDLCVDLYLSFLSLGNKGRRLTLFPGATVSGMTLNLS